MRFGDSASNAGVLAFFGATNREDVPVPWLPSKP